VGCRREENGRGAKLGPMRKKEILEDNFQYQIPQREILIFFGGKTFVFHKTLG